MAEIETEPIEGGGHEAAEFDGRLMATGYTSGLNSTHLLPSDLSNGERNVVLSHIYATICVFECKSLLSLSSVPVQKTPLSARESIENKGVAGVTTAPQRVVSLDSRLL